MGTTLTGKIVADTYDALIKVTDNNTITGTKKRMTDGLGNDTPLLISSTDVQVDGNFLTESVQFNTATSQTADVGKIVWNQTDGTFDMGLLNDVTLQAGQELHLYGKASGAIGNGQAVMFAGVEGDHLLFSLADRTIINANPEYFIGVSTQDLADNQFGYITILGKVRDLDTTGYTMGATLYYNSESETDGLLTETMPTAPNAKIIVAAVVRVHITQGTLMVRPHVMPELHALQDVQITSIADNQVLYYEASNSAWNNASIASVLGYTPINGPGTTNYIPKFTGSTALGNSLIYDNGTNVGIGTTTPISIGGHTGVLTLYGSNATALVLQDAVSQKELRLNDGNLSFTNSSGTSHFYIANAGEIGIGSTSLTGYNLRISKSIAGAATSYGISVDGSVTSTASSAANGVFVQLPVSGAFTLPSLAYFRASGAGAFSGAAITTQYGFTTGGGLNAATNNYCFHSSLAAATGRWNLYMEGTANNYLAGVLTVGTTSPNASAKVQIDTTTQGFLPPRMTSAQRTAIASPATGLVVYQTDGAEGLYVKKAAAWALITAV